MMARQTRFTLVKVLIVWNLGLFCVVGPLFGGWVLVKQSNDVARRVGLFSNAKVLAGAALLYSEGNDGRLPLAKKWRRAHPGLSQPGNAEFAYSKFAAGKATSALPKTTVLFLESDLPGDSPVDEPRNLLARRPRYGDKYVISCLDGNARLIPFLKDRGRSLAGKLLNVAE
ncbi:MAG: hypothetical protein ACOYON_08310 [Fimbriimonas sp.]